MIHTNIMKCRWCEHRGDTWYYHQSDVNMMFLLAQIFEHKDFLKKNIKHTCSTKLQAIEMEYTPPKDSTKAKIWMKIKKKWIEKIKRTVEVAKDKG